MYLNDDFTAPYAKMVEIFYIQIPLMFVTRVKKYTVILKLMGQKNNDFVN